MRTDARAGGYGVQMGTIIQERQQISLSKRFVPYPEDSWAHERGRMGVHGVSDETTPTHRLLTHSQTPTHRRCGQVICLVIEQI